MLKVENLSFSYPGKDVLKDISFSANRGDLLAILGPNAVGKTTLINILTGKLDIQMGNVTIKELKLNSTLTEQQKQSIGVMRPITGIFLKMTCFEYLSFIGGLYNLPLEDIKYIVIEIAKKYSFEGELSTEIKKCSAGTIKKLEFSSAIIHNPDILFLDEPFETVDPIVCLEIKTCLKEYALEGKTILITSHILDTIQNLCDKYIIINNGYIVNSGEIKESTNLEKIFVEVVGHERTDI